MERDVTYHDSKMAEVLPPEGELIFDLEKLAAIMGEVAMAAPEIGLPQFRYGFHGYQRVTQAVTRELETDMFEYPEKMAYTMPHFAERAFAPIRHYVNGDHEKVGGWSPMVYGPAAKNALPSTAMVDFLGFHVVYDLPFTLVDTNTQPYHRADYSKKINIILESTAQELLPEYAEVKPIFKRFSAETIGLWYVLRDLYKARDDAWRAFEQLNAAGEDDVETIEQIDAMLRKKAAARMLSSRAAIDFVIRNTTRVPDQPWGPPATPPL